MKARRKHSGHGMCGLFEIHGHHDLAEKHCKVANPRVRAWEWEDGGGFTIWGTHHVVKGARAITLYLRDECGLRGEDLIDAVPAFTDIAAGTTRWLHRRHLDYWEDWPAWEKLPRFWWFGRVPIRLVSL